MSNKVEGQDFQEVSYADLVFLNDFTCINWYSFKSTILCILINPFLNKNK